MTAFTSCLEKQQLIEKEFATCNNSDERYQKIISFGKQQPTLQSSDKTTENRIKGCQSQMFLTSWIEGDRIRFAAESDALISAGLAVLLIRVYDNELPEALLKCPPDYLERIGIPNSLSPGRAVGLLSLHKRMLKDALAILVERNKTDS